MKRPLVSVTVGLIFCFLGVYFGEAWRLVPEKTIQILVHSGSGSGDGTLALGPSGPIWVPVSVEQTPSEKLAFVVSRFFDQLTARSSALLVKLLVAVVYYTFMVIGILTGSIYEALDRHKAKAMPKFRTLIRSALGVGTWQGVIASPMLFMFFRAGVPSDVVTFPMLVFSYQAGFFWRATMKRMEAARNTTDLHEPARQSSRKKTPKRRNKLT